MVLSTLPPGRGNASQLGLDSSGNNSTTGIVASGGLANCPSGVGHLGFPLPGYYSYVGAPPPILLLAFLVSNRTSTTVLSLATTGPAVWILRNNFTGSGLRAWEYYAIVNVPEQNTIQFNLNTPGAAYTAECEVFSIFGIDPKNPFDPAHFPSTNSNVSSTSNGTFRVTHDNEFLFLWTSTFANGKTSAPLFTPSLGFAEVTSPHVENQGGCGAWVSPEFKFVISSCMVYKTTTSSGSRIVGRMDIGYSAAWVTLADVIRAGHGTDASDPILTR